MDAHNARIVVLTQWVEAACGEVETAIQFHEAWKIAATDAELMARMSHCYAGNTFLAIRAALRREVILALMRLWDKSKGALSLKRVADSLSDPAVITTLANERARNIQFPNLAEEVRKSLQLGGDAHAFLMAVYKNPAQPMEMRIEAAKAAIRYEKPALATVDLTTHGSVVHEIRTEPLSPEERDKEWLAAHGTAH